MEDIVSLLGNIFGVIIFCLALSLLFFFGTLEYEITESIDDSSVSTVFYQE